MALNLDYVQGLLGTFDTNIEPMIKAVGSLTWLIGLVLVITGILSLSKTAKAGGPQQGHSYNGAVMTILIGAGCIYLPTLMITMRETMFGSETSPLSYGIQATGFSDQANKVLYVILHFIQFVGVLSFVRGWLILNKVANGGGQNVSLSKGVIHILGGILAANIVITTNMLSKSFGYDFNLSV